MPDAGTPAALREHAAAQIGGRAFVRISRGENALFVTDLFLRVPPEEAERRLDALRSCGWIAGRQRDLCLLTPSISLTERLCRSAPVSPRPWNRASAFAAMLARYALDLPADASFVLCELRSIDAARHGDADALRRVKSAYARGLADGKNLRTHLTASLAAELAGALAERGMA